MGAPTAAEMKRCFDKIDTDGGGTLSLEEVEQAMAMMKVEIAPADLARSFARADSDNEGELDLQEFTQLVKSLEHGPVRPTPSDRRSEAALALRTRRHRHAKLSQGLDTTTFRHQWTSTEDAKDAPRRSADRVVHRATWARQPEDWGGLRAGFEDTLVEPWDEKLGLPEWQRDIKPPAWLRRAKQRLSGAEERRTKARNRLRAISTQAATLQRESEYAIAQEPSAAQELKLDHDRHYIEDDNDSKLTDPSFSQLRRNHSEQLRRVDTAQSVEHFLYYLPADQASRFGHLHDQLVESRPSTAGDPRIKPARLSALAVTRRRSGSHNRSNSRGGSHSRVSSATGRFAPLSVARLRNTALAGSQITTDNDDDDLGKWGGWADDIHAIRDQELQRSKMAAEEERAAVVAREQAAQHAAVMKELQTAVKALREAQITIERYRKALGKRVGWQELLEMLRRQKSPNPEPEVSQSTMSSEQHNGSQKQEQSGDEGGNNGEGEMQEEESLAQQAARRARLIRRRKLAARANLQALKLSEQEVTARATAAREQLVQSKVTLAFAKRDASLQRRCAARAAIGVAANSAATHDGGKDMHLSPDKLNQMEKVIHEAGTWLALEEYSLLALKDEQSKLKQLLHETDSTLPLTTRRSGLSQAKPPPKATTASSVADDAGKRDLDEDEAALLNKAEVAAKQIELLGQRVAQCRNAALRSLAARLRQTEKELALRKGKVEDPRNNIRNT